MEDAVITGIAYQKDQTKITLHGVVDTPGIASGILSPISDEDIEVDVIVQNVSVSGKLCPVSIWTKGKGILAGENAFFARWVSRMESFPPENRIQGFSNCAATSRSTYMASDSNSRRWLMLYPIVMIF